MAAIVTSAMDAIVSTDGEQRITLFNPAAEKMFGRSAAETLGQPLNILIPARHREAHLHYVSTFGKRGVTERSMGHLPMLSGLRADGSEFPIEVSISQAGEGEDKRYIAIIRDATEQRRAALQLSRTVSLLRATLEATADGIVVLDSGGRPITFNRRYLDQWGLDPALLERNNADAVPKALELLKDPDYVLRTFTDAMADQSSTFHDEIEFLDGRVLERHSQPAQFDEKTWGRVWSFRDVTKRKHIEAELRESRAFLEEAQELAGVGNWWLDIPSRTFSRSRQSYRLIGLNPADEPSTENGTYRLTMERYFEQVHPADREAAREAFGMSMEFGLPLDLILRFIWPDDSVRWLHGRALVERDSGGKPIRLRGVSHDVTALKESEQRQAGLQDKLLQAQKLEAIGTLAGGIAHDFNNILYGIKGFGEMVLESLEPDSQAWQDQQEVLSAARRAEDLVRQILTFCRQSQARRVPVGVATIVKEVVKMMRAMLPATIEVHQELQSGEAVVIADPIEVHQVLVNLCTNAGQAMAERGGKLTIGLRQFDAESDGIQRPGELSEGRYYLLSVADTGPGIPPELIDRIYEPFFTTKEVGEGTGLGLSIVHGVVRELGGAVTVYSEPGQGAEFHVYLPAASGGAEGEARALAEPGSERVLFVDDEESIARLGRLALESLGYRVEAYTSPLAALERFTAAPGDFDIVISDETMPRLRGSELAARLQELRPGLPVILCTGYSQRLDDSEGASSVSLVLHKPLSRAELSAAIRRLLDNIGRH